MITGDGLSGILLLTESLEDQSHFNFDRLLRRSGIPREQFYYGTSENGWFSEAAEREVKVVVPLGEKSLRRVIGQNDIMRWRGRIYEHPDFPFFVVPTFNPKYLVPRRQPKEGQRDPEVMNKPTRFQGRFLRDLLVAQNVAQHGFSRMPVDYLLDPSPEVFQQWVDRYLARLQERGENETFLLSFDTETPYKRDVEDEEEQEETQKFEERQLDIIRWSFAYEEGRALSIPNTGVYRAQIERLLVAPGWKTTTNGRDFDLPVLAHNAYRVGGVHIDTFDLMKFWQSDLPKGLEAMSADTSDLLPWKHLSDSMPAFYSATDADATLRGANFIIRKIKEQGAWDTFMRTFVRAMPHFQRAGDRGNAIDLPYQSELRSDMDLEGSRLHGEIQTAVPRELKPRKRYKRDPIERERAWSAVSLDSGGQAVVQDDRTFVAVLESNEVKTCSRCKAWPVTKGEHTSKKSLGKILLEEKHHPKKCSIGAREAGSLGLSFENVETCSCPKGWPKRKWETTPNPCHGAEIILETHPTEEWDEILPFNTNSAPQLISYMEHYGHPVGTNPDDPDKDSADAQHLKMLDKLHGRKHPLYSLALGKKQIDKAKSTYLWIPSRDGFIHQTYTNSPNTLRLGGRAYNLMNVGKKEDKNPWAFKARRQITARPGHVLVQADSTSIEGVMQGWYMGDEHFMWLANQSIHAWLTTQHLGWDFNQDTVEKVKKEKKALYDGFKVGYYTTGFGGSPYGMHMANRDLFPTSADAQRVQDRLYELIPKLEAFHYHVRYLAQKQTYIESPWKWRGYFYDVYTYKRDRFGYVEYTASGRPKLKLSKDGKRVVAVLPQHSNAMFGRENTLIIGESKWGQYMPANYFVHDGYTLDVPMSLAEEAEEFLLQTLTRPIPQMGGLRVGAASDIGYNWGDFHETQNPRGMKSSRKVVIEKQNLSFLPSVGMPEELLQAA